MNSNELIIENNKNNNLASNLELARAPKRFCRALLVHQFVFAGKTVFNDFQFCPL